MIFKAPPLLASELEVLEKDQGNAPIPEILNQHSWALVRGTSASHIGTEHQTL